MKIFVQIVGLFAVMLGQTQAKTNVQDTIPLEVSWQPIENNYLGKEHALSVLEIRNNGTTSLPKEGWRLYFNFIRIISPKTEVNALDVHHVNGDLFYFTPADGFNGLEPGESLRYEMVSHSWIVNVNDAPQGFYLVWDDRNIQLLPAVHVLRPVEDKKFYRVANDKEMTPAVLFEQNQKVKDIRESELCKIFPTPTIYQEGEGAFRIDRNTKIVVDPVFENEAKWLREDLSLMLGDKLAVTHSMDDIPNAIRLSRGEGFGDDGYSLDVHSEGIVIRASRPAGAFYAIQSLKTLIAPYFYTSGRHQEIEVTSVAVKDESRFARRAVMLDVSRNFQTKGQIMKMLDVMALYKLNTLHFHLNDDEGWRLEIPSFPELTGVSGQRQHLFEGDYSSLPPSYGSGPFAGRTSGSGYYGRGEFIEILQYAKDRHIQVIPEIETPGHARSAIKAMEARYHRLMAEGKQEEAERYLLQDFNDRSVYRSVQKWNDNVMDVSMPSVYRFLDVVTDDLIEMYQEAGAVLSTIHFGGDEVPQGVWERSPAFELLKSSDPAIEQVDDLWDYFFDRICRMMDHKGLHITGWEEVGLHKITGEDGRKKWVPNENFKDRNIHVNVWNNLLGNEDLAYRLANSGYKVILSFVNNFYFDMAYYKQFEEPGFYWGGFTDLEKPFSFIPFDYLKNQKDDYLGRPLRQSVFDHAEVLTEFGKSNIVGIQGLLWSETVKTPEQMEYMIFPRILALAEQAWAKSPAWAEEGDDLKARELYEGALARFYSLVGNRELKRLDQYAGGFHYRIPAPGVQVEGNQVHANCELPGFTVRYTTDGSTPTVQSPVYDGPLERCDNMVFRAFNGTGRGGQVSKLEE